MGMGGNKNSTFPTSSSRIAEHQILLMDPCFGIVICHKLLDFTLDVHETLFAVCDDSACVLLKIWSNFFITVLFRALLS